MHAKQLNVRLNHWAAQTVQQGIFLQSIAGTAEAKRYMERSGIPAKITERVLPQPSRRREFRSRPNQPDQVELSEKLMCRRSDLATAARVDHAVALSALAGSNEAKFYLEGYDTPEEVIRRIFDEARSTRKSRQW